ncbi:hypothetical protein Poly24_55430 [Rosistilla carotiformis]|uniref:Oligosaccharide repeat unit polymerase n=1 Tax=Rosistilla carotiformis TaxID=2528017 RepID=A0A518K1W5_9BACT|nr:hypothetical protein [Rosistilla carotiformis]QDV71803.1 hypothetical protein Poly24_55430 [Rosistilla carotiformis]
MSTVTLPTEPTQTNGVATLASIVWQPCLVFMPFLAMGGLLWLCPSMEGAAGYRIREELSMGNLMVLVGWYGCIFACAAMGQRLALSLPRLNVMARDAFDSTVFYKALTCLAFIGVAGAWMAALRNGVSVVELIKTQQFNLLKDSLYANYNHLYTLRYTTSLVGGYALYRLVFLRQVNRLDILNLCLMLAATAISARILIIQAVIFSGGLAIRFDDLRRVKTRTITIAALGLAICIVAFTWVRSAGSYRDYFGVENPLAMTFLEIQRYVGAPVQASMGVARMAAEQPSRGSLGNLIKYTTPTFLHPDALKVEDNSGGVAAQWYLHDVDIDETLTTNSAFVEMYGDLGFWAFPVVAWASFLMAAVGSYFWRADNLLCLIGCVVLYGFFELWRTFYFTAGSFTFMILAVLVAATAATLIKPVPRTAS